ncbi:MAG TPA: carboxypeptidase-like regulatory domain-containing protein, partial [Dyadobacter sp.]|nr:carboxypeptidase-like regulatory domain-containing protein [Dyadobacter sp.]
MKYIFTVLCLIGTLLSHAQQAGKSHVKGHIQTSDGKAGSYVTVQIKNGKSGTVTDENGNYQLRNVPAGKHTLVISIVGFESAEYEIETTEESTLNVADISLREDARTLREVTVKGNVNKFAQKESPYVSRLPLKNLENPQVYNVISKDL